MEAPRPRKLIDSVEIVDLLDATGIRLSRRIAGVEVFSLHHRFCQVPGGTQYDSTVTELISLGPA